MSLAQVRAEIARYLNNAIDSVAVIEHGGPFTLEELKRVAARAPALVVTCLGVPALEVQGTVVVAHAVWAVFGVTKNEQRRKRDVAGLLLAESVMVEVPHQTWNGSASKAPRDVTAANLYSSELDRQGVSLWAIRWRQQVDLQRNAITTLDDFETFFATYVIGDADAPVTEDQVDLPT